MAKSATVTYDGSRLHSSGAHIVRSKSTESIGLALEAFRCGFTDATRPTFIRIDLQNIDERLKAFVAEAHARCAKRFGEPAADFGRKTGGTSNWFLDQSQLLPALSLLDSMRPIPADELGFGVFRVSYRIDFRLVDPVTRERLPFQEPTDYLNFEAEYNRFLGKSYLDAELSERSLFSAFFSLPFEQWDERSEGYVCAMQADLPFPPKTAHMRPEYDFSKAKRRALLPRRARLASPSTSTTSCWTSFDPGLRGRRRISDHDE
jgi:hypothetical protein